MNKPKSTAAAFLYIPWLIVAVILLAAALLIGSKAIARWTSASEGSANAQVALFAIDASAASAGDLAIDCSTDETTARYAFTVINQKDSKVSQVKIAYYIVVTLSEVLPDGLTVKLDDLSGIPSDDGKTYTFSHAGWELISSTVTSANHELIFAADPNTIQDEISIDSVSISILSEQIQ